MTIPTPVRRRQQQVARWVRRTPGYRWALVEVLPRIRRNAVLTDLAWRVFAPRHGAGQVDVALLPDRHLTGPDVSMLPVVGFLATGLGDEEAGALLEQVADLQRETASFRPVLVLDRPVFGAARAHGYVVEHLVPAETWAQGAYGEVAWEDYVARRVAGIIDHYQLWHLLRVGEGPRIDPLDLALLRRLGERLPDLRVAVEEAS